MYISYTRMYTNEKKKFNIYLCARHWTLKRQRMRKRDRECAQERKNE